MRIVGVHGVHQYRPGDPLRAATELANRWGATLAVPDAVVEMAYYADLIRKPGAYGEPLNIDRLDADAWSLAEAFCAWWLPDLRRDDGRLRVSPRTAMGILAGRRNLNGKATHGFVVAFARETARFLRTVGTFTPREAVMDRVARRIDGADVVVAYSQGAVVAYETLLSYSRISIPLFVTLGSPLSLPGAVFPRLSSPEVDGRREKPPNVDRWVNITDTRDLFAVPGYEIARWFNDVDQDVCGKGVASFDFHQPDGYLASGALAAVLRALAPNS